MHLVRFAIPPTPFFSQRGNVQIGRLDEKGRVSPVSRAHDDKIILLLASLQRHTDKIRPLHFFQNGTKQLIRIPGKSPVLFIRWSTTFLKVKEKLLLRVNRFNLLIGVIQQHDHVRLLFL